MKKESIFLLIICGIFLFSCNSNFHIEKRKYRPGWFVESGSNLQKKNNEAEAISLSVSKIPKTISRLIIKAEQDTTVHLVNANKVSKLVVRKKFSYSFSRIHKTEEQLPKIIQPAKKFVQVFLPLQKNTSGDLDTSDMVTIILMILSILLITLAFILLLHVLLEFALVAALFGLLLGIIGGAIHDNGRFDYDGSFLTALAITMAIFCGITLGVLLVLLEMAIAAVSPVAAVIVGAVILIGLEILEKL
jgi:hypothetical protein